LPNIVFVIFLFLERGDEFNNKKFSNFRFLLALDGQLIRDLFSWVRNQIEVRLSALITPGLPDGIFSNQKSPSGCILEGLGFFNVGIFCGRLE
jgi:hypothetical protein